MDIVFGDMNECGVYEMKVGIVIGWYETVLL